MQKKHLALKETRKMKLLISNLLLFIMVVIAVVLVVNHETDKNIVKIQANEETLSDNIDEERTEPLLLSEEKLTMYTGREASLSINDRNDRVNWKSSDESIATVSVDGVITALKNGTAYVSAEAGDEIVSCKVKVKKVKQVALTFDDGPGKFTPVVLDALEQYDAKATFFVIGNNINSTTTQYVKRASDMGCQIGNHTYNHINLTKVSKSKIERELKKTDKLVKEATGSKTTIMRAPYGALNNKVINQIDKAQILWNVDTLDWKYLDTDRLVRYVLKNASDGDIILMHDIHESTALAIEQIVKGLYDKGFEMLTVDELAAAKDKTIEAHVKYGKF